MTIQEAALERRHQKLRSQLRKEEMEEAVTQINNKRRTPCSAGIGAFQVCKMRFSGGDIRFVFLA